MRESRNMGLNLLFKFVSEDSANLLDYIDVPTKNKVRQYSQNHPITEEWKSLISHHLYIENYLTTIHRGRILFLNTELYTHYLTELCSGLNLYSKIINESFQICKGTTKDKCNQEVFRFRAYSPRAIANNRNSSRRRRSRPFVIGEGIDITFDTDTSTHDTRVTDETIDSSNILDTNTEPESDNNNLDVNIPNLIPLPLLSQSETEFLNLLLLSENSTNTGTRPD